MPGPPTNARSPTGSPGGRLYERWFPGQSPPADVQASPTAGGAEGPVLGMLSTSTEAGQGIARAC